MKGFTLIEAVAVMLLLGILAAVVILRSSPFGGVKLEAATRKVASDVRYARELSLATQKRAGLLLSSSGYSLYADITNSTLAEAPEGGCSSNEAGKFVVDFSAPRCREFQGVSLSYSSATLAFSATGALVDASGTSIPQASITVSYQGSKTIVINGTTGRVSY